MEKINLASSAILFVFGLIIFILSLGLTFGSVSSPGPGFLPRYASLILVLLSVYIGITSLVRYFRRKTNHTGSGETAFFPTKNSRRRIIFACGSLFAYSLLSPILGFAPATFAFFALVIRSLGFRKWRTNLVFSFCITIVFYLVFQRFLRMALPVGIFRI